MNTSTGSKHYSKHYCNVLRKLNVRNFGMPEKRTLAWESSRTKKAQTSCTLSTIFAVTELIGNTFRLITPMAAKAAHSEWVCSEIKTISYCYFVWGLVYSTV